MIYAPRCLLIPKRGGRGGERIHNPDADELKRKGYCGDAEGFFYFKNDYYNSRVDENRKLKLTVLYRPEWGWVGGQVLLEFFWKDEAVLWARDMPIGVEVFSLALGVERRDLGGG